MSANYCPSCGAELTGGAKYCPECGGKVFGGESNITESNSAPQTEGNSGNPADATPSGSNAEPGNVLEEEENGIQWERVGMAVVFALIPAFIAYLGLSLASGGDPVGIVFLIALPVFGYLLYQRPTAKAMVGGMLFYLSIEFLFSPLVFLLYTIAFASENTATGAEQAGAAIGGFALTIGAFVIGVPLAIALYLASRRLDPLRGA